MARLPDFVVIGAYKAGTTAVDEILRRHPDIHMAAMREPNHFAFAGGRNPTHPDAARAVRDYESYLSLFTDAPSGAVVGEVSPAYMSVPGTAQHLHDALPDARLVAVLRNPVDRAFSDYLMYLRDGRERAPLRDALTEQEVRREAGSPTGYYVHTGMYAQQLRPFIEAYGRDRLHVLLSEELIGARDETLARLFAFLGVDADVRVEDSGLVNAGGLPDSRWTSLLWQLRVRTPGSLKRLVPDGPKQAADAYLRRRLVRRSMSDDERATLERIYAPEIEALESLLDRPLPSWRSA